MTSLRDFDPENEDFGSEVTGLLARNKKGASLQHGHLGDVKASSGITGFDEKKYAGKSVSRRELESSDESESDEDMSDYLSTDDSEISIDSEFDSNSDYDSESYTDESDFETVPIKKESELSARMKELELADTQAFDLISQSRPVDHAKNSEHVRNQLVKFDDFVDLRFKLQPLLNSSNRLPQRKKLFRAKKDQDNKIGELLDGTVEELEGLMKDLLELSVAELEGDSIEISKTQNPRPSTSKMQQYWDEMSRIEAALDPFAQTALQKWHNKMTLSSDLKAKKTLKMLNQDPYQQVQIALQDEERLVARTRVFRDNSKKRIGCDDAREFDDIFDDNDFYQVLLKDWTASHGALSSSTASAMSTVLLSNGAKKQHREGVDHRASKGRKIRYDVHPKLVNYMVPQIEKGAWIDSKIDEFFVSLLGQSK